MPGPLRRGGPGGVPLGRRCWPPRPAGCAPTWWPSATPTLAPELADGRCPAGSRCWRAPRDWPTSPPLADVVLNGVVGFAGLPVTLAALEAGRRLALANKESLIAGAPRGPAGPPDPGCRDRPGRLRALRPPPVPAGRATPATVARLLLTASGGPFRGRTPRELAGGDGGRRAGPSDLGDGPEDHGGLLDPDEQGPRGHRGPRALRRRLRPHRRRGPPPVGRALDGGVHRRSHRGPAVHARHAPAHRLRARLSRAAAGGLRRHRLDVARRRSSSRSPTATASPASTWPTRPAGPGAWRRPG